MRGIHKDIAQVKVEWKSLMLNGFSELFQEHIVIYDYYEY